jgi:hypothetical protein
MLGKSITFAPSKRKQRIDYDNETREGQALEAANQQAVRGG